MPARSIHPALLQAVAAVKQQQVTRREFIHFAALLGLSTAGAYQLLQPTAWPTAGQPVAQGQTFVPAPIPYGGTWTAAMPLPNFDHPARLSWPPSANICRQVGEYLTEIDPTGLVRPYLVEGWDVSEDLKSWTLHIRRNVTFNNGDPLQADDVYFSFRQWLDPNIGSPMLGILRYLGTINNVEKVDAYTIKLHLTEPSISVPEDLAHSTALVLHRNFAGDFLKQPLGTGAFLLKRYLQGEVAEFERRPDYWRKDKQGGALPYLDRLRYMSLEPDQALTALRAGLVDTIYQPRLQDWEVLRTEPGLSIQWVRTGNVFLGRMRVDQDPWRDNRVRQALKLCQDRLRINKLAYGGQGELGIDAHIAPSLPEYAPQPIPAYDPEQARALLQAYAQEKGLALPLPVTLATKNDFQEPQIAQALKALAEPAGFAITLDITNPDGYWARWTEVPLGITHWVQTQPATAALQLAYTADQAGKPVAWNETRWVDAEFVAQLTLLNRTLNLAERRTVMSRLEAIMQERGPVFVSFWNANWKITRAEFKNVKTHPLGYDLMDEVWKEPALRQAAYLPMAAR